MIVRIADGPVASATFNRPLGLAHCRARDRLYVADTESHAVRCVDWMAGSVSTLAGNGIEGVDVIGGGRRTAAERSVMVIYSAKKEAGGLEG